MTAKYVRIQARDCAWVTGYPRGVFGICWRLIREGRLSPEDEQLFRDTDKWFREYLPEPKPCKNGEKVITFFKTEAAGEMLAKLAPVLEMLDRIAFPYDIVYTNAVGTAVYEDEWQIAVRVENGVMV